MGRRRFDQVLVLLAQPMGLGDERLRLGLAGIEELESMLDGSPFLEDVASKTLVWHEIWNSECNLACALDIRQRLLQRMCQEVLTGERPIRYADDAR